MMSMILTDFTFLWLIICNKPSLKVREGFEILFIMCIPIINLVLYQIVLARFRI